MTTPAQHISVSEAWTTYKRLLGYTSRYWYFFVVSIFGFLIYAGTQTALAHMMKYFVEGLEGNSDELMVFVPVAVLVISLLRGGGFYFGSYYLSRVALNVVNDLRKELFNHMLYLPGSYHDSRNSGELVSMITYNVNQVTNAATKAIKTIIRDGLTVIALLIYLLYMNWMLTMAFLLVTPILAALVAVASKKFRRLSIKMQASMGAVTHVSNETLQGYQLVKSYRGEEYESARFNQASDKNTAQGMKYNKVDALQTPILQMIIAAALAGVMFMVLYMAQSNGATPGDLVAYVVAAGLVAKPVRALSEVNAILQKGIAAADSIFNLLAVAQEQDKGTVDIERLSGEITIKQLSFAYEPGKPVLSDINLSVKAGQTIAIVGRSGSGKTTLAKLLLRLYDYEQGSITLDGHELKTLTMACLRHQVALVNQQVVLFNDTVHNNIAYGQLGEASAEAVREAATQAEALEFIEALPQGFATLVGEDGTRLSGGQRQRISIARALLKDAPILILDEATSALDTESERNIQRALDKVMTGRTTIVIAHRLSTIEKADVIVVMEEGRIVELGSHHTLMNSGGAYAKMLMSNQSLGSL